MSEGPNLDPPMDEATSPTAVAAEAAGDDVARMGDLSSITESINADFVKLGCSPIEISLMVKDEPRVSEVFGRGRLLARARDFEYARAIGVYANGLRVMAGEPELQL